MSGYPRGYPLKGYRIDTDTEERIMRLTRAGYSSRQIAGLENVRHETVLRVRRRNGIPPQTQPKRFTTQELSQAEAMLNDGASYGEVARTLGRSQAGILRRFPGRSSWKQGGCPELRYQAALDALPCAVVHTDLAKAGRR